MKVQPSGVVMIGECDIQLSHCTGRVPAPITAVFTSPGRKQVDVCRPCLEDMIRAGEWEIAGAKLTQQTDLTVYDDQGRLQLVVEVREALSGRAAERAAWATRVHRNLLSHSAVPHSRFFLLAAFPSPFYLWVNDGASVPDTQPDYHFDVQEQIQRYADQATGSRRQEERPISVVSLWLNDTIHSNDYQENRPDWLFKSGLLAATKGGRVVDRAEINHQPLARTA